MQSRLHNGNVAGVDLNDGTDETTWLKLLILFYADDSIILSDNEHCLNSFYQYCNTWKMQFNITKTKIIIFDARNVQNLYFKLGNDALETTIYKYLGVVFSSNGSFLEARKHNVTQVRTSAS